MKKLIVLLAVGVLAVGCGLKKKQAVETVVEVPKVLTKTAFAEARTIDMTEVFTAEIQAWKENDITPAAQGVHIDKILVDVGDKVRQGQLLATLDPTQYDIQRVQLQNLQTDYNRLLPVYKAGGISSQQIDQAKTQLEMQREVVNNLNKNIRVLSPLTGVVTARNNDPGDLFMGMPILHVMDIAQVKVVVHISEQFFPYVKVGMPVELTVEVFPGRTFEGKVASVYPALDPATRTFTVEVKVPNAKQELRPGMYSKVVFNMGEKEGIMVPDVAVQKQVGSSERYLYVINGDVAERRSVEVGRQVGSEFDILKGVVAGEQVATAGLSRLSDGATVEVRNQQED